MIRTALPWLLLIAVEALGLQRPTWAVLLRLVAGMALLGGVVALLERGQDGLLRLASPAARSDLRRPAVLVAAAVLGAFPAALLLHRLAGLDFFRAEGHGLSLFAAAALVVAAVASPWRLIPAAPSPRQAMAGMVGAATALALFVGLHHHAATLIRVPVGRLALHLGLFIGTWAAALVGAWLLAGRALRRVDGAPPRRALGAAAIVAAVALAVADQRLYPGLYPSAHHWLKAHAYLGADLGISCLIAPRPSAAIRRLSGWGVWAALALLGTVGWPRLDVLERASLAGGAWGRPLVELLDRSVALATPEVPDPALDAALALPAPRPTPHDGVRPNLLLITVDALRADAIPPGGRIDRWMDRGVRYERAYAQGAQTDVSVASLMAGRYPLNLPWRTAVVTTSEQGWALADGPPSGGGRWAATSVPGPYPSPLLAERLRRVGYRTAAVAYVGDDVLFPEVLRLEAGFDSFDRFADRGWHPPADGKVVDLALERLGALTAAEPANPWFLWVHLYDPHESGGDPETYRSLVAGADSAAGRLLDHAASAQPRPTWMALTADHGEALGERGATGHGASLSEAAIRVPLLLTGPGLKPRRELGPVALVDLTATLCALAGADRSSMNGVSLLEAPDDGAPSADKVRRPIFSQAVRFYRRGGRVSLHLEAMIRGPHKLIWDRQVGTEALYDVVADLGEAHNLALRRPVLAAELGGLLRYRVARGEALNSAPPGRPSSTPGP